MAGGYLHNMIQGVIAKKLRKEMTFKCSVAHEEEAYEWLRRRGLSGRLCGLMCRPDAWIVAENLDLYPIEVGNVDPDKWFGVLPMVRVSFRGGVGIYNGYGTIFEVEVQRAIRAVIEEPVRAYWVKKDAEAPRAPPAVFPDLEMTREDFAERERVRAMFDELLNDPPEAPEPTWIDEN